MTPDLEPRHVTYAGAAITFHALEWGEPTSPLMLCLHGYPDSPHTWRDVAPLVASAGYRVVAPWTRGYAPTDQAPDGSYHVGSLVQDALELHQLAGGDGRAVLIGHDWGAVVANAVAAQPSQPFADIVSIAVPPLSVFAIGGGSRLRFLRDVGRQLLMSWYTVWHQIPLLAERSMTHLVPWLWRRWSPGLEPSADLDLLAPAFEGRQHDVLSYYRHVLRPWSAPAQVKPLQRTWTSQPRHAILYLHGVDDGCLHVSWAERAALSLPDDCSVHVLDGCGHFLQRECPDVVAQHILSHVNRRRDGV